MSTVQTTNIKHAASASNNITLDASGNVGMGTASPGARLGVSDGTVTLVTSPFAAGFTGYFGTSTNHPLALITNNAERMRIDASGNVGIGTSSPVERLQVIGRIRIGPQNATNGDAGIDFLDSSNTGGFSIRWLDSTGYVANLTQLSSANAIAANTMLMNNNGGYRWSILGSERMRINGSGNVGIGQAHNLTNTRLAVAGQSGAGDGAYATGVGSIVLNETGRTSVNDTGGFEFKTSVFGAGYGAKLIAMDDGSLAFATRSNTATYSERARITSINGDFQFNSGYGSVATAYGCRAWVNFDGTGTLAVRGSGGLSSVTDIGVGDYRLNFAFTMPDINYSVIATKQNMTTNVDTATTDSFVTRATTSVRVVSVEGNAIADTFNFNVAIFR